MTNILTISIVIVSVLMIIAVMMQPAKTNNASGALSGGGADDLFSKQKPRGFEAFMQKVTFVLGILFFGLALGLVYLASK
ncbi:MULTISPECIES: preprotein translocase subunit SecG [Dellaglioa]|uniref:Protein-export membrane protein SecG n=2 Tax=Dellaglioa TaxID=2767880 RepID=A0A2C8ENN3_9LACO|nr:MULTISPECIES: preprotein translocase subunit SecG [Dellaglioa]MCZ2490603.1 preprotein translocase subunit SecG [Dellaglioa carnosa]MCZ2492232.1 preprotein translocase subunit SecG [Dellaglioa carnosa]MCZ2493681.1 preprotein translocase subunit SecG [Dellaglioa carnosa]MDK1716926.1 preprotein translocase subunit SecG [Dellaglioa algida]MDK1718828.1 preprotein translocase subunit SecG [Dellaglioa algida]